MTWTSFLLRLVICNLIALKQPARNFRTISCLDRPPEELRPATSETLEDRYLKSSVYGKPGNIIMKQSSTPTTRFFGLDSSNTLSKDASTSRTRLSDLSQSENFGEAEWDSSALRDFSNSVRASIRQDESIGSDANKLSVFLEEALKDEECKRPTMDFETIMNARLDKLLDELIQFAQVMKSTSHSIELPLRFQADIAQSKKLRVLWRHRFREKYAMIDKLRCAVMVKGGRLKESTPSSVVPYDLGQWQTDTVSNLVSEAEGNQQFEPGHWWLNNLCAHRDGIVGSPLELATSGRYGITALPMLTGREELVQGGDQHVINYIREGRSPLDMLIPLISQVGRQIRILRGYRLKSVFAPKAGVRYDGLYIIRQYGTKLDEVANVHRLVITLDRLQGQKTMGFLNKIPMPSQLDDWELYMKLEGSKIKLAKGNVESFECSVGREVESLDRLTYVRDRVFQASFSEEQG